MDAVGKIDLQQLKQIDVCTVDRDSLVDIRNVQVDRSLPCGERFADFLRQVKNPYCFRCGEVVVKVYFADTDVTLEERLKHYLETI